MVEPLKFFSSVRLDIRRIETIKVDGGAVGNRVRVKVVKNKCSAPFRQAEFDIMYGTGISREGNILDMAVDEKIVTKSGSWYTYGDERLGQGREAAKNALVESPDLRREIENKVRAVIGLPVEYDDDDAFTLADVPTTGFSGSENLPDSVVTENSAAE